MIQVTILTDGKRELAGLAWRRVRLGGSKQRQRLTSRRTPQLSEPRCMLSTSRLPHVEQHIQHSLNQESI